MQKPIAVVGDIVAVVGVVVCIVAGGARLAGSWHFLGFESGTVFIGGIGLMVMGCLAKLHTLSTR